MKRDLMKLVNENCGHGRIPTAYDMTTDKIEELRNMAKTQGFFEAIEAAFVYGFVLGSRAERKGAITRKL